MKITDKAWEIAAQTLWEDRFRDGLEIDQDTEVSVSLDGDGAWVRAWVWVPREYLERHAS